MNIERLKYLQQLKYTNDWLEEIIDLIQEKDKDALIIMIADHGGFVGMNYTLECKEKQENEDIIRSIFTSALAIKWPGEAPEFDGELKTGVNLFRVLFSYLSEDESYLNELQEDSSFTIIEKGAPYGVYEYIDNNGNIVFNKFSN